MAKDMTTGKPLKLILLFTLPLILGNVFQLFYSTVDILVVGRFVGPKALAAVGSTGALSFLIVGFATGLMAGFSIIIAQCFGKIQIMEHKDYNQLRHAVAMSIVLTAGITALITFAMVFLTRPLLVWIQTPDDIIDDAYSYIFIVFMGMIFTLFYNLASSIMRAIGDSHTPLYLLIFSSILNVLLDLLFVPVFHWDIPGVAIATITAQGVSAVLSFIFLFAKNRFLIPEKRHWKMEWKICGRLLKIGMPNAFMNSITAVGCMVTQAVINSFGSTAVAAYTAAARVEEIATQPGATLGIAFATFTGQNCGAKRFDRIKEGMRKCLVLSMIINAIASVIVLLFANQFTMFFVSTEDAGMMDQILKYAWQYQFSIAVSFWALGLLFLYRNALQGLGNPLIPFWSGVLELVARSGIAIWWAQLFGFFGMCWANAAAWISAAALLMWGYYYQMRKLSSQNQRLE